MTTFKELGLIAPLQRALDDSRYEHPTEIQARAIPPALEGRDILGCAQTGTGKTAAFVLPTLDYIASQLGRAASGKPFALILAPTRELAIQIGKSIDTYGRHLKIRSAVIYGGVHQSSQVRAMHRGAEILVATPGRLLDLMQQGFIDLSRIEVFVLDEADHMLDMGFLPDLKRIIQHLPRQRQSLFFSATLDAEVSEFAKSLLFEPVSVTVTPKPEKKGKIEQHLVLVAAAEKPHRLHEILTGSDIHLALVFTRTKRSANQVEKRLREQGVRAAAIHGNKSQANRQRTLEDFRRGQIQVLVATDVAARGIDVCNVTHVVNYDLPADPDNYVHRIGRTGRAGKDGTAITFYTADQHRELQTISRLSGIPFEGLEPTRSEKRPRGRGPQRSFGPRPRAAGYAGESATKTKRRKPGSRRNATKSFNSPARQDRRKRVSAPR
ncbi:MAG: DEAD/DEAH box helicase [Pirellulaceae bacterium]|nr:DEAD/DEAH box helicase [Planctomycetales bacterium]